MFKEIYLVPSFLLCWSKLLLELPIMSLRYLFPLSPLLKFLNSFHSYYISDFLVLIDINIAVSMSLSKMSSILKEILMLFVLVREILSYYNRKHSSMTQSSTSILSKLNAKQAWVLWLVNWHAYRKIDWNPFKKKKES